MSDYVKKNYLDSKSDLFAVFIERCGQMTKINGLYAMITQHAWMFQPTYTKLRSKLLKYSMVNMPHLGARAFEEIGGEVVQTTSFVYRNNNNIVDYKSCYMRLIDYGNQESKKNAFIESKRKYIIKSCILNGHWLVIYGKFHWSLKCYMANIKVGFRTLESAGRTMITA